MTEEFIGILEDFLGVSHTKISIKEEWTKSALEDLRTTPITEYLKNVSRLPVRSHDCGTLR